MKRVAPCCFRSLSDVPAAAAGEQAQESAELGKEDAQEPFPHQPARGGAETTPEIASNVPQDVANLSLLRSSSASVDYAKFSVLVSVTTQLNSSSRVLGRLCSTLTH